MTTKTVPLLRQAHVPPQVRNTDLTPVTILTGFLGSGKTTLLNYILHSDAHGLKIAIVQNEYGEISVDADLVAHSDEEFIEMSNGCCLCCTARTDILETMQMLGERRDEFDHIIIETSGLADPDPVAQTLFIDEGLTKQFRLDGVVTLVDAKNILDHLEDESASVQGIARQQIAFADRVVITKTDLVEDGVVGEVEEAVRKLNDVTDIRTSHYGNIELDNVLKINGFSGSFSVSTDTEWLELPKHMDDDSSLGSVSIMLDGEVDIAKLRAWLDELIDDGASRLYRYKGILYIPGDKLAHVLQGVHSLYDLDRNVDIPADPERRSKLVFIGRDLDEGALRAGVASCALQYA